MNATGPTAGQPVRRGAGLRSLTNKVALLFAGVVLLAFGVVYFYIVPQLRSNLEQQVMEELAASAEDSSGSIEDVMDTDDPSPNVDRAVQRAADDVDARVTLLGVQSSAEDAGVFYAITDSNLDSPGVIGDRAPEDGSTDRAERPEARDGATDERAPKEGGSRSRDPADDLPLPAPDVSLTVADAAVDLGEPETGLGRSRGELVAQAASPLRESPAVAPEWVAVYSRPLGDVNEAVGLIQRQVIVAGALAVLVALAGGWLVARAVARRVRRLESAAREFAEGKDVEPLPVDSEDELGQLTRAFNEMQEQLARVDRSRRDFIANASHELRTPIFSLGGFAELLQDEELDPETRERFLASMREQIDRLQRLAADLLDLSRLDAGALAMHPRAADVTEVVEAVIHEFAPVTARHHTSLAVDVPAGGLEAHCDPDRVAQIVRILLDNALRHNPPGHPGHGRCGAPRPHGGAVRRGSRAGARARRRRAGLRALLHRRRLPRVRPRPGDRARAGRADGRADRGALGAGRDGLHGHPPGTRGRGRSQRRRSGARDAGGQRRHRGRAGVSRLLTSAASAAVVAIAVLTVGCGGDDEGTGGAAATGPPTVERNRIEVVEQQDGDEGAAFDASAIYDGLSPGVVTVISVFDGEDPLSELGGGGSGLGSGFILDEQGRVATNAHVVSSGTGGELDEAQEVYVEFGDGNRVPAEVVGTDPFSDVALLEIDPAGLSLTPLELGSSEGLTVGQPVAAIGSPFGERQSLSIGVISAVNRDIESLTRFQIGDAIQTDAAINQGNSGGPLLDAQGRVLGINAQIRSASGGGVGVGFAIPVDTVQRSLDQLREDGQVSYAFLGVSSQELYPQLADHLGIDADSGALVVDVVSGSPADEAGIAPGDDTTEFQGQPEIPEGGDAIVAVDGEELDRDDTLADLVENRAPGTEVELTVVRGDERSEVTVTLEERELRPGAS